MIESKEVYKIDIGDYFIKKDTLYKRINDFEADKDEICAINLNTGEHICIYMLDLVIPVDIEYCITIKNAQEAILKYIDSEDFLKKLESCNTESGFEAGAMWGMAIAAMVIDTKCDKYINIKVKNDETLCN